MARPKKSRRICALPSVIKFKPVGKTQGDVNLSFDEYEAIRLIDYVGLNHEECAKQMDVARSTVTSVYETARRKLAEAIVDGKVITVNGGDVEICENSDNCCGQCGKNKCGNCNHGTCENCDGKCDSQKKTTALQIMNLIVFNIFI